ncbi:MAG: hypothetical protein ACR2O4_09415 [Hyphomicrobiaceae bacterium]
MSAKRWVVASALVFGTYLGAGALMYKAGPQKGGAKAPTPSAETGDTATTTTKITDTASGTGGGSSDTAAKATPANAPSFVELKLSRGEPQVLAGRAPKGTRVTTYKGGSSIGSATAGDTGNWTLPLDKPIAEKSYTLTLKSAAANDSGSGTATVGQSAVVSVDDTGRANVEIKPAPDPKAASNETDKGVAEGILEQATRMAEAATEKFSDIVGGGGKAKKTKKKDDSKIPAFDGAPETTTATGKAKEASEHPLEFAQATIETVEGSRPTVNLAGKSAPGAELGVFIGDRRIAGTFADPAGVWSISKPIATGAAPLQFRVDQFDSRGTVIASETRFAKRKQSKRLAAVEASGTKGAKDTGKETSGTTTVTNAPDATPSASGGTEAQKDQPQTAQKDKARKRVAKKRLTRRKARQRAKKRRAIARYRAKKRRALRLAKKRARARRRVARRRIVNRRYDNPAIDVRVTRLNQSFGKQRRGVRPVRRGNTRYIRRVRP